MARAHAFARAAGILVIAIGAVALAGWTFDIEILKGFYAGITMKANTAVALLLTGTSLTLGPGQRGPLRHVGIAFAAAAAALGVATLSQHVIGWNLGIDQLLFREAPGAPATASPGRMGPPASTCFVLAGFALACLHAGRYRLLAQGAAIGVSLAALLAVTGYAYGVESLYGIASYTGIALHTAAALLVLSLGVLAASAEHGIAAVLAGDGAGSVMARRLLGVAVLLPLLVGWLRLWLENAGLIDTRFGVAAIILVLTVVLSAVILRTAVQLNRLEWHRLGAEAELRARLDELQSVMEVAPIGLFLTTDPSAEQITGNRIARELLRMPHPAANLSLSAPEGTAPAHFRVLRDGLEVAPEQLPVQRAAREGLPVLGDQLDVVFSDGTVRHQLLSALPLLDEAGRPRGAVGSMMDITELIVAQRERGKLLASEQAARTQAEAANRAKDDFLATVSHELRTPLNAILGWTSMLRDGTLRGETAMENGLATIERACRVQTQLIEDLLDVSRIIAGQLRLDVRPVDLATIINAAVDVVRPAADAKAIALAVVMERTGARLRGDPARLQQVVWNLLSNAVKFSEAGSLVEVRLAGDHTEAHITVTDSGSGIDPDFLPHVFDRFTQEDSRKTRRHGGLGLGLSIARDLVEMHGGTLEAESQGPGTGARFTLRLPLPGNGAPPDARTAVAAPAPEAPAANSEF